MNVGWLHLLKLLQSILKDQYADHLQGSGIYFNDVIIEATRYEFTRKVMQKYLYLTCVRDSFTYR